MCKNIHIQLHSIKKINTRIYTPNQLH
uniref:Uncharacterized protein n=1 Tax=Rhizophora mucronata TaxID=61149 RepID=A0A2P2QFS4_RHIMU